MNVHTVRALSTSDVWVSTAVQLAARVTQFTTDRRLIAAEPDTITSIFRSTKTQVRIWL